MRRIIVIGDVHGDACWKLIVQKEQPGPEDFVVFMGDYFDSFTHSVEVQLNNFFDIIEYRKNNPNVVLLFGNHDHHYYCEGRRRCSGYEVALQAHLTHVLGDMIKEGLLQMAFESDGYLFTHAGVTNTWFKSVDGDFSNVVGTLNDLLKYKPQVFEFTMGDNFSIYGDDVTQSPIWVRPMSLCEDYVEGFIHVVGHTHGKMVRGGFKLVPEYVKPYKSNAVVAFKELGCLVNVDCIPHHYAVLTEEGLSVKKCDW